MIEVYRNLFVGGEKDFAKVAHQSNWAFVQCAKEPWHRQALGYVERSPRKDDPEYLIAVRPNRLILNMVDAPAPEFFRSVLFYEACDFIEAQLFNDERKVLVHCNKGESRGPSVAMVYLAFRVKVLPSTSFMEAVKGFAALYPRYSPGKGIREFLQREWESGLFE